MTAVQLVLTDTPTLAGGWRLSSSSDPEALRIVDGLGDLADHGPHYSRRTPGSRTFTGIGREIVLVHESRLAVWAVVEQRTPSRRGSGASRGRNGAPDPNPRKLWRNNMFRRIPGCPMLASDLIRTAYAATLVAWRRRYGALPNVPMRTEVSMADVRSRNPGYCYKVAGWRAIATVRGKLYLEAPEVLT